MGLLMPSGFKPVERKSVEPPPPVILSDREQQLVIRQQINMLNKRGGDFMKGADLLEYRLRSNEPDVWYHGGYPGLNYHDMILPAADTDYVPMQQMLIDLGMTTGAYADFVDWTYDPNSVYLTHNRALARDHAAGWAVWNWIKTGKWEPGRLYKVIPQSLLVPSFVGPTCCCLTHGPESPCSAKTSAAMVDYVDVEVMPMLTGMYPKTYEGLRYLYSFWKLVKH